MDRFNTSEQLLFLAHTQPPTTENSQYSLVFIPGLITGRLFDMGIFKVPLVIASVWLVMATFLVAECRTYWQFLLCQGFAVGVSFSLQHSCSRSRPDGATCSWAVALFLARYWEWWLIGSRKRKAWLSEWLQSAPV